MSIRIAFASSDGISIDSHFGQAQSFYLWDVDAQSATALGVLRLASDAEKREDRILARVEALAECTLVYTVQIGGPAAAKLAARHIQPVKAQPGADVVEAIAKLQAVLRGRTPPWLRRAEGVAAYETQPIVGTERGYLD